VQHVICYVNCVPLFSSGIGLNVDNEKPTTCLNAALQELKANLPRLTREDILASFFNKFEALFEIFSNQGIFVLIFS
jgi:biotin--protein ligase